MILAVDFGLKKVGVAISDETNTIAEKLTVILAKDEKDIIKELDIILEKYQKIDTIIFGLPLGFDFKPTLMSELIKKFVEKFKKNINKKIKIDFTNEVYSTQQAERGKSKKFKKLKSDSEAARIFLQEYLDHNKP